MANGDAAAAAGYPVVAGTADRRLGYDEINRTRDIIVQRVYPISQGGTGAATAAAARTALGAASTDASSLTTGTLSRPVDTAGTIRGDNFQVKSLGKGFDGLGNGFTADLSVAGSATIAGNASTGGNHNVGAGLYSPYARAGGISGGLAIYVAADGLIAKSSSSKRYKKAIKKLTPDLQAILAMELVEFQWRATGETDHGLIAEQLDGLGLEWLIFRDEDGRPEGVRYERIGLALLGVVQDHEARLAALEARHG